MTSNSNQIQLVDVQTAIKNQDPSFVNILQSFIQQADPETPEEAMSFYDLHYNCITSYKLLSLPPGEERMHFRQAEWKKYLEQKIEHPPRLELDKLLLDLYKDEGEWGRQMILQFVPQIPLRWGAWRALKKLFKLAETTNDYELLGILACRFDVEYAEYPHTARSDVANPTLLYLRRRGWRYLKHLGQSMPELYPYAAIQFLRWYPDWQDDWSDKNKNIKLWVLNHLFFHNHTEKRGQKKIRKYGRQQFKYNTYYNEMPSNLSQYRAFPELWTQSPEPLLDLLLLCRGNRVAQFAIEILNKTFKTQLRELPLEFLIRLGERSFGAIQLFVKDLIEENPAWQKAQFKELGLHDLVTEHFLYSPDSSVRQYAITYSRDYASDLSTKQIFRLLHSEQSNLQKFAIELLENRDAREELGLDTLQKLFLIPATLKLAQKKLKKGFRPSEIPLEWFEPMLFNQEYDIVDFAINYLKKEFPQNLLNLQWFQKLLRNPDLDTYYYAYMVRDYAIKNISNFIEQLDSTWLTQALLDSEIRHNIEDWIDNDKISKEQLDFNWVKTLFNSTAWRESEWVKSLKKDPNAWIKDLSYPEYLQDFAFRYLGNPKRFTPEELGINWLIELLQHDEVSNQNFAFDYMLRYLNPIHFADHEHLPDSPELAISEPHQKENPLAEKSFLFTGKLRSLTRSEAHAKVEKIEGIIAKSVTKKLDYLVVGDEGSPLFSEGKKGSKLVKAEKLQESGSSIQIISETKWLQMLSEGSASKIEIDPRLIQSGFQRLFMMATDKDSHETIRDFAIDYLQKRHPILGASLTKDPLEGEQIIPRILYRSKNFLPLMEDERSSIQKMATKIARFELRRWEIPPSDIFKLCESPHRGVRQFALESLLGAPSEETIEEFYFKPEELDPDLVFALTESRRRQVREVGILLLSKHYDLLDGDNRILRLAESPDRDIRTRAVQLLWMRYRHPTTTQRWQPTNDQRHSIRAKTTKTSLSQPDLLINFVRTVLFGIPPGRLEKRPKNSSRLLPNSKAKIQIIELVRDLAMNDRNFYIKIEPLLQKFLFSGHKSESLTCLVALTQLEHNYQQANLVAN